MSDKIDEPLAPMPLSLTEAEQRALALVEKRRARVMRIKGRTARTGGRYDPNREEPNESVLTQQEEEFAQAIAAGYSYAKAAERAGYKGDPSNAYRRARVPRIAQRIEFIARQRAEYGQIRRAALRETEQEKASDLITVEYLVTELKSTVSDARDAGDFKSALAAIKALQEMRTEGGATNGAPSNREVPNGAVAPTPIPIQILNQISTGLGEPARGGGSHGPALIEGGGEPAFFDLPDPRSLQPASVHDEPAGEHDDELSGAAEGGST